MLATRRAREPNSRALQVLDGQRNEAVAFLKQPDQPTFLEGPSDPLSREPSVDRDLRDELGPLPCVCVYHSIPSLPTASMENVDLNYEDTLLDFVRRTRENLLLTDRWQSVDAAAGFHEVTNLVNSLLGLIVIPKERVLNRMQQLPVDEDGIASWRVAFRLTKGDGVPPTELRPFLVGLRNAIAHASMEFGTDGASITGIRFLNRTNDKAKRILWEVAFDLDGLRGFLDHLTDEVERACRGRT